jgi:hypothetical protein
MINKEKMNKQSNEHGKFVMAISFSLEHQYNGDLWSLVQQSNLYRLLFIFLESVTFFRHVLCTAQNQERLNHLMILTTCREVTDSLCITAVFLTLRKLMFGCLKAI